MQLTVVRLTELLRDPSEEVRNMAREVLLSRATDTDAVDMSVETARLMDKLDALVVFVAYNAGSELGVFSTTTLEAVYQKDVAVAGPKLDLTISACVVVAHLALQQARRLAEFQKTGKLEMTPPPADKNAN